MAKIKFDDYRTIKPEIPEDELAPTDPAHREVHPRKVEADDEKRINFRIIKCCLNCKYHFSSGPNSARMGCLFPYTLLGKRRMLKWPDDVKPDKSFLLKLTPTHATCVCASHQFIISQKDGEPKVKHVTKYCNAEYLGEDDLW